MPGIGVLIEGAVQQAPHRGLQDMLVMGAMGWLLVKLATWNIRSISM
jgi:hypothetical protein